MDDKRTNMITNISSVIIWSENYKALADWYKEKLQLIPMQEFTHPQDSAIQFLIGNSKLWIGQHSEVHGKNKDSFRHMINLTVDSVTEEYEKLKNRGVTFIAEPFKAPTMEKYFSTFYDLDNNIIQLVGNK